MPGKNLSEVRAPCPLSTRGRNRLIEDLVKEPVVLKANEGNFNIRLEHRNRCSYILSERVCRLLLPPEAAEVPGLSGLSSHDESNCFFFLFYSLGHLGRLTDIQPPAWGHHIFVEFVLLVV